MKATDTTPAQSSDKVAKTDVEWRKELTPDQYRVLRRAGTEQPFGETYEQFRQHGAGTYCCAGCGAELFSSKEKFDSHCGWPSFYDPANAKNVTTHEDISAGIVRVEVQCARCGSHLGHVFKGEGFNTPTDLRYCINGVALKFVPASSVGEKAAATGKL
ncbi:MAG: peptide-methionine (R)-S-oxide reductase MsrB [Verrucomicrobia bacterium]|nr:peptide-methionine (R)-S-oxide reductase MsrB [Verrucomicrobiota bacterium]